MVHSALAFVSVFLSTSVVAAEDGRSRRSLSYEEFGYTGEAEIHTIHVRTSRPARIWFQTQYETHDACNTFAISGDLLSSRPSGKGGYALPTYVAALSVGGTQLGCQPGRKRRISLTSPEFEITPEKGEIWANVIVPKGFHPVLRVAPQTPEEAAPPSRPARSASDLLRGAGAPSPTLVGGIGATPPSPRPE